MNTKTMSNQLPPSIRSFEELRPMFDYDRALPLKVEESGVEHKDDVSIHDVSYASPSNGRVRAYLVMPPGKGPFAGVIFVHPAPGNRSTFLEEAVRLAKKGAVSLLMDAPWAQGEAWARTLGQPESDRKQHHQTAINIRRAVDVIISRTEVDAARLGYVGHSFGALFGGVLAGVEKRIRAYVLMAGVGSFTDVAALNIPSLTGQALEEYSQVMGPIDPIYYIGHAAPSALFFQFGSQDDFFSKEKFWAYYQAGSEPKFVKWYNADHFLDDEEARDDRMEWLGKQLHLE